MKTKKIAALILALVLILSLGACSSSKGGGSAAPSSAPASSAAPAASSAPASSSAPAGDTAAAKQIVLSFASSKATGSLKNKMVEEVLKSKLEEKSGGLLTLEIYPSNTLAGAKEMLDALNNGTADLGYFVGNMFAGQFPLTELFGTPGLKYGDIAAVDKVLREYTKLFHEKGFDVFKIISRYSIGTTGVISVKPVTAVADIKGMSIRATSNFMGFFTGMGANCVSMGAGDVYEAIKTNVINGTVTGLNGLATYKLAEVCNAVTPLYMLNGDEMIVMSMGAYDYLSKDLQAVVDQVAADMDSVLTEYTQTEQNGAIDSSKKLNAKFQVVELSAAEEAKFTEAAKSLLDNKAAELDKAGLEGSKALAWLRSQQPK